MTDLQKTLIKTSLLIGGVFIAQDGMAMTDGALRAAWEGSNLENLIGGDIKKISALVGVGVAGVMAVFPKTQKAELIGGTFAGIVGTGFLLDWVKGAYAALI